MSHRYNPKHNLLWSIWSEICAEFEGHLAFACSDGPLVQKLTFRESEPEVILWILPQGVGALLYFEVDCGSLGGTKTWPLEVDWDTFTDLESMHKVLEFFNMVVSVGRAARDFNNNSTAAIDKFSLYNFCH